MVSIDEIWFDLLEHLDSGATSRFLDIVKRAFEEEVETQDKRIEKMELANPTYAWQQEVRDITFGELWQSRELAGAFVLVALNQNFETTAAHCLEEIFGERPNEPEQVKKTRQQYEKQRLNSIFGRLKLVVPDLESLPGYSELDELREISNAWKHDGFVTEKLAATQGGKGGWEHGRPLDGLDDHYERLKNGTTQFCKELSAHLRAYWTALRPAA